MPPQHISFFEVTRRYRVPGFLSASYDKGAAAQYLRNGKNVTEHCILWTIRVKSKHVYYIRNPDEEYLFPPYFPFMVLEVRNTSITLTLILVLSITFRDSMLSLTDG